jgi:hypothetical protein
MEAFGYNREQTQDCSKLITGKSLSQYCEELMANMKHHYVEKAIFLKNRRQSLMIGLIGEEIIVIHKAQGLMQVKYRRKHYRHVYVSV